MASLGGKCQPDGTCKYPSSYKPFLEYPHAMGTNYCGLEVGGCSGALGDPRAIIEQVRDAILSGKSIEKPPNGPVTKDTRFGVTANPPLMIGNSGEGVNLVTGKRVASSSQGSIFQSGICYDVIGPGGRAILIPADRCAGYCLPGCGKTGKVSDGIECGPCVSKIKGSPTPNPPCVGTVPGLYSTCSGMPDYGCKEAVLQRCDWCASQNHPHFDMDNATYNAVCGAGGIGSCELTTVKPFKAIDPPGLASGGQASPCADPKMYSNGHTRCTQSAAEYAYTDSKGVKSYCCCPWGSRYDPVTKKCT